MDIQYCFSYRCTHLSLDSYTTYEMITLINPVPIWLLPPAPLPLANTKSNFFSVSMSLFLLGLFVYFAITFKLLHVAFLFQSVIASYGSSEDFPRNHRPFLSVPILNCLSYCLGSFFYKNIHIFLCLFWNYLFIPTALPQSLFEFAPLNLDWTFRYYLKNIKLNCNIYLLSVLKHWPSKRTCYPTNSSECYPPYLPNCTVISSHLLKWDSFWS